MIWYRSPDLASSIIGASPFDRDDGQVQAPGRVEHCPVPSAPCV